MTITEIYTKTNAEETVVATVYKVTQSNNRVMSDSSYTYFDLEVETDHGINTCRYESAKEAIAAANKNAA